MDVFDYMHVLRWWQNCCIALSRAHEHKLMQGVGAVLFCSANSLHVYTPTVSLMPTPGIGQEQQVLPIAPLQGVAAIKTWRQWVLQYPGPAVASKPVSI